MAHGHLETILAHLHRLLGGRTGDGVTDGQLLGRFLSDRDESAFTALVERHGPMVLGLCRRLLRDPHAADDAFQATFFILVHRARHIRKRDSVGSWLYGVAYRTALRARAMADRQPRTQAPEVESMPSSNRPAVEPDMRSVLDEELNRLPEKYRQPVVLCYLEGKTSEEAARQLGWPKGTVFTRLNRARERLRSRLERRGIALPAVGVAAALGSESSRAAVSPALLEATTHTALLLAAGKPGAALAGPVASLTEGVLHTMWLTRLKLTAAPVLVLALVGLGTGAVALRALSDRGGAPAAPDAVAAAEPGQPPALRQDGYGNPLPPGALLRLGTTAPSHRDAIHFTAYLAGGAELLAGSYDSVRVWDASTGREVRRIGTEAAPMTSDKALGDPKVGDPKVGDPKMRGQEVKAGGPTGARLFALSDDGKMLATGGDCLQLWDVASGKELRRIELDRPLLFDCRAAFTPDGKTLAVSGWYNQIRLFDVATGRKTAEFLGHMHGIGCLAISRDGKLGVSASFDIRFWEPATGKERHRFPLLKDQGGIRQAAFSADGRYLALGYDSQRVQLWDVATVKPVREFGNGNGGICSLAFAPDSKALLVGAANSSLTLWDVETGRQLKQFQGDFGNGVLAVAFAPDGKALVASGENRRSLFFWDVTTGREIRPFGGHERGVLALAYSPDSKLVASIGGDNTIRLCDLATGREVRRFGSPVSQLHAHPRALAFSPDGKFLAAAGEDKVIHLYDAATGAELRALSGHERAVTALAFTSDSRRLLSAGHDPAARLWEVETGKVVQTFQSATFGISAAAVAHDGRSVATAGIDGMVRLWDPATGEERKQLAASEREVVLSIAFAPGGKTLAAVTSVPSPPIECGLGVKPQPRDVARSVRLWDVATGQEIRRHSFKYDGGLLGALSIAPDGKTIAWAAGENQVRLWEVASGQERGTLPGHQGPVSCVAFAPDGKCLAAGSQDGTILVWEVNAAGK